MWITVRELLQLPHLRLTLTAGEASLDRQVSWVHSSDLPNPWEWLGPAELLLTNGTSLSAEEPAQVGSSNGWRRRALVASVSGWGCPARHCPPGPPGEPTSLRYPW